MSAGSSFRSDRGMNFAQVQLSLPMRQLRRVLGLMATLSWPSHRSTACSRRPKGRDQGQSYRQRQKPGLPRFDPPPTVPRPSRRPP